MRERLGAFWQIILSQLLQMRREPEFLFWAFLFPILLTLGLGIAFREKPPEEVVVGLLRGAAGTELQAKLKGIEGLKLEVIGEKEGQRRLRRGRISLLIVPGPPVVLRLDPVRPDAAMAKLVVLDALQRAAGRTDPMTVGFEEISSSGDRYIDFLIPGLLGLNMMNSGLWGLGFLLVEMRLKKLLKRLMATPMPRADFLMALLLCRVLVVFLDALILLAFGRWLFGVQVAGSAVAVGFTLFLGIFCFSCIGLLIGSRARKIETAMGLINLASMPMLVLSGVFFSYERFPEVVHPVIRALPLTALNDLLRALINDGASLLSQGVNLTVLLGWSLVCFFLALVRFRWS